MIDTEKLDTAIMKRLSIMNGDQKGLNTNNWDVLLRPELGVVDLAEIQSAMKRLCADGIVRLRKYDEKLGGDYEYRPDGSPAIENQFFGFGSFDVLITDQGRRFLSVRGGQIGFKQPA
jgi:hypothetical protein